MPFCKGGPLGRKSKDIRDVLTLQQRQDECFSFKLVQDAKKRPMRKQALTMNLLSLILGFIYGNVLIETHRS